MILSYRAVLPILLAAVASGSLVEAQSVGKWRRHKVQITSDLSGASERQKFEHAWSATFTHVPSGTRITLPGYYDGSNTFEVGFMPTLVGQWNYTTSSADAQLNGVTGSVTCVESGLPGMLKADTTHPKKWKFTDGPYVVPIAFRMEFFSDPATAADWESATDFLRDQAKGHMYETRLTEEVGQFGGRHDFIFEGSWQNHIFDLEVWNRMEERMEVATQKGLGGHLMLYSDDGGTPGWSGQSATEALLVRYLVARLAGYPVLWINTGIDIAEYRSQADIDWLGDQFRQLDPYGHPISSRQLGGSGNIEMSGRLFESQGNPNPARMDGGGGEPGMLGNWADAGMPVSQDDAWGENRPSHGNKNHTPADIRRAFWKAVIVGGSGGLMRGGGDDGATNGYFSIDNVAQQVESEQWLRFVNPFIQDELGTTFGVMVPSPTLVSGAKWYALADPARTKILYLGIGNQDTYDGSGGGSVTVKLSSVAASKTFTARWFDTRTGAASPAGAGLLSGGNDYTIAPPSTDDWVLWLDAPSDTTPPTTPQGLAATAAGPSRINLVWSAASDPDSGIAYYGIYRDGSFVGQAAGPSHADTGLTEATAYTYRVSAVNGSGVESAQSGPASATTSADVTPPTIASVATLDANTVVVVFSEPVGSSSASTAANYSIDNGISVGSASLGADLVSVSLATSAHATGTTYTLTVSNVTDRASSPNPIVANSQASYAWVAELIVSNVSAVSGRTYTVATDLAKGSLVYTDRGYTYSAVPGSLVGSTYIRTPNADKSSSGASFLTFDVNQGVTVWVAHDDAFSTRPSWLAGSFTDSGLDVTISTPTPTVSSLYRRDFPAGTVVLGGNVEPGSTEDLTMYSVILVPGGNPGPGPPPPAPTGLEVE